MKRQSFPQKSRTSIFMSVESEAGPNFSSQVAIRGKL